MHRTSLLTLFTVILLLAGGCSQVGNIRIADDSPGDLDKLIEDHEYLRVRQLTGKYPSLDSPELQAQLKLNEQEYEQAMRAEASALETGGDLYAAVQLLSGALQKVPHSGKLRELRNSIEQDRANKLRINQREDLLARGRHLAGQLRNYDEYIKLEPPGMQRKQQHERNQADAISLADLLMEHAHHAMEDDDLNATRQCLNLSRKLNDSPEAIELHADLQIIEQSLVKTNQQKASIKKARKVRKQTRVNRQQTEELLKKTQQALNANQLHEAKAAFTKIPQSSARDKDVIAVQNSLEHAVDTRVEHLMTTGDSQYRADRINAAMKSWNEALSLDPDNTGALERTERATKVLARLQELKNQQKR